MNNRINTISFNPARSPLDSNHSMNGKVPSVQRFDKSLEEEGRDENTKNQAEKKELDRQKVNNLVKKSNRCIISVSSAFPWNIFPSTIEVEEGRVTFIIRQFMSSQSHTVDIKDISNVFIETSFFFATLQIVSRTYIQNDIKINYLHKEKAKKVKMIIEGLRTFLNNDIDTSNYEVGELVSKLSELHTNIPEEKILPFLGQQDT
ncbi:hypothetical protein A2870_00275 [Candidatus Curtissbacteria bacterium RIFCSPHIGHO2_01_FULL_41_11]|uniref:Uncharacterized protein n=1 Tax=Candidatus Curtissbacteria bacterium RIFCSPHIGHO2_01_FULL_41_11 TaxID=1797711 RepID=A0A1F5G4W5_9BACT|nr:MAG: hypothetical protein A2870_00275 [Candidatus Curtissbacteria bacterium RIFCSPHIGHO2_01_FULL_41_11]